MKECNNDKFMEALRDKLFAMIIKLATMKQEEIDIVKQKNAVKEIFYQKPYSIKLNDKTTTKLLLWSQKNIINSPRPKLKLLKHLESVFFPERRSIKF